MKKKIYAKVLVSGLCLGLLIGGVQPLWAFTDSSTITQQQQESSIKTYTLEDIKTFSEINGSKVLQQRATMNIAEADAFYYEINYYDARNQFGGMGGFSSMMDPAQAWMQWDTSLQKYKDSEDSLEEIKRQAGYEGENRYFSYLQLDVAIETLQKTIELQEKMLNIEKLKVELGMSTQNDVNKIALEISELKNNLSNIEIGKIMAATELMRQIGQPVDTEFQLATLEEYPVLTEKYELTDLVEKAIKNSLTLKQLDRAIEDLDENIDEGGLTVPVKDQLAAQANSLKLTRKEALYSIRLLAKNGIDEISKSQANLQLLQSKVEKAQTDYDRTLLQYELGVVPKILIPSNELALLTAKDEFKKAQDDHYLLLRSIFLLEQGVMVNTQMSPM